MIFPWARVLISAGAHGLRRIPGQSVNLAHPIWRAPRAPAPLQGAPPVVFRAGLFTLPYPFSPLRGQLPRKRGSGVSQLLPLPLPHSWGSSAEGGEGVFQQA